MVILFAILLSIMAIISYYWQQYTSLPLLNFALGVMAFAYASLLGVYGAGLFTNRGNERSVLFALIGGFMTVFILQPYIFPIKVGFSLQIIIGTIVSFSIMMIFGREKSK
jgi:Na+/proline symporter